MNETELQALGIKPQPPPKWLPIPDEWTPGEYKNVEANGKTYQVVPFLRPNETVIELWGHSLKIVEGRLCVRDDHLARQAELARKKA